MAFTQGSPNVATGPSVPRADTSAPGAEFNPGESIGSFEGRLVRPKPSRKGLTAQILGENGPAADVITTFHLSHFLDLEVKVQIVLIKDSEGRLLKKNDEYPRITPFDAIIKRPATYTDGLVAQLFAENGPNADIVSELSLTKYLDAMVYVKISKASGDSVPLAIDREDLDEASKRLTPAEEKGLQVQQKLARGAWNMLKMSGFFRKDAVLRALGDGAQFAQWVGTQPCCHPGESPCQNGDTEAFLIPDPSLRFRHVPLCHEHAQLWESGSVVLPNNTSPQVFLIGETTRLVHQWAQVRLRELLATPAGHDPTPSAVQRFAIAHHLTNALPDGFAGYFSST